MSIGGVNLKAFDCRFTGNSASDYGGAIYSTNSFGTVVIHRCTFEGNTANYDSGAVGSEGPLSIKDTGLFNNSAPDGGAVGVWGTDAYIDNCTCRNNHAGDNGGCIYHSGSDLTISNTVLGENDAYRNGGAVYASSGAGNINFDNCTFMNNAAAPDGGDFEGFPKGGAVYIDVDEESETEMRMNGTTFANNTAGVEGQDVYFRASGSPRS